jgi:hypothetical protein
MPRAVLSLCLLGVIAVSSSRAAERTADKAGYTLVNPTPEALMRELTTDRPDTTESPFTVDAGHAQLELDFASYTHNRLEGVRTRELALMPFNLRLGLRHNWEMALAFDPFIEQRERLRGEAESRTRGVGDTTLRTKFNFWGNDGGSTAFGLIADVKLPPAARALSNGKVEGALILPFAFELAAGWDAGANTSLAAEHDGRRCRSIWANTFTVSHGLVENVSAFGEITSSTGDGPHVCTFDTGVAWRLGRDAQLDAGVNLGISRSAPDVRWFTGLSRRF